jgi:uncharacterized membrane protein YsdA (DUF1294 family)/cold shock CspA family protein
MASKEPIVQGEVESFDSKTLSGFVRSDDLDKEIFFHLDDVEGRPAGLRAGAQLKGRVISTPKGSKLVDIRVISLQSVNPYVVYSGLAVTLSIFVAAAVWTHFDVHPLVAFLCGINVGAIFFMGLDKVLSRSKAVRTPEAIVYTMALLGGSPGVLLGIHVFKHKTRKAAFQFVLLLIVAAQFLLIRALGIQLRSGI